MEGHRERELRPSQYHGIPALEHDSHPFLPPWDGFYHAKRDGGIVPSPTAHLQTQKDPERVGDPVRVAAGFLGGEKAPFKS
jgi:hypothetical protein